MAERLLDLVVTRAEHHLSCAVLWAQTPGKDCSAAFPWMLCLPGGTAWFAAAETGTAEHTLGNTHQFYEGRSAQGLLAHTAAQHHPSQKTGPLLLLRGGEPSLRAEALGWCGCTTQRIR